MICQIYSATSAIEARELLEAGTDFIGIFPVDDPDYQGSGPGDPVVGSHVSFATARDIIEAIRGRGTAVVLSLGGRGSGDSATPRAVSPPMSCT